MSTAPSRPGPLSRRRSRWAAAGCAVVASVLLVRLFTIQGPGSWQTVWWFGLPGLVGVVGMVLAGIGRHLGLAVANLVCGVLSGPLLLIIATLVLGP